MAACTMFINRFQTGFVYQFLGLPEIFLKKLFSFWKMDYMNWKIDYINTWYLHGENITLHNPYWNQSPTKRMSCYSISVEQHNCASFVYQEYTHMSMHAHA